MGEVTDRQLAALTEKWRKRLVPDWQVVLVEHPSEYEKEGPDGTHGEAHVNAKLRKVKVWVNRESHPSDYELEETVVHELLHALVQPIEDVFDDVRTSLGMQESLRVSDRLESLTEPTVERLSRALVAIDHGKPPDGTAWA